MESNNNFITINLNTDNNVSTSPCIIKVIGVGGGGGNAINHMYNEGIDDVTYVVCNTDNKALQDSPVPCKIQLGSEGLGAGNRPERARAAALESIEEIRKMLSDGTRMVFITAGMGGGTGTGAAPIVAQCAMDAGILTVGIVTIPFEFEGVMKQDQALDGVEELSKHVDALLVINNERLRDIYPELTVMTAFAKADDTLSIAARSIAEIITMHGRINMDFQDVKTVLKDGGVALMSSGEADGENRVTKAIENAIKSPLLNNNSIESSRKILINITCSEGDEALTMQEMGEIHEFMQRFQHRVEVKWGLTLIPDYGKKVKITLLATGFGLDSVPGMEALKERCAAEQSKTDKEQEEEREQRRREYYNHDANHAPVRRRPSIFVFGANELDNDDIISRVESTPTYKRTKDELKMINASSEPVQATETE